MHVILTSSYPVQKVEEMQKVFLEASEKYPIDEDLAEHLTPVLMYGKEGLVNTIRIFKIKEGKLEDFLNRINPYLWEMSQIEGYKYDLQNAMSQEEAAALVQP